MQELSEHGVNDAHVDLYKIIFGLTPGFEDFKQDKANGLAHLICAIRKGSWGASFLLAQLFLEDKEKDDIIFVFQELAKLELPIPQNILSFIQGLHALHKSDYDVALAFFDEHYRKYGSMASCAFCAYVLLTKPNHDYNHMMVYLMNLMHEKGLVDWMLAAPIIDIVLAKVQSYLRIASSSKDQEALRLIPQLEELLRYRREH